VSGVARTLARWRTGVERAEVSLVESTVRVPSLLRLTPRLARLVMPLLPVLFEE